MHSGRGTPPRKCSSTQAKDPGDGFVRTSRSLVLAGLRSTIPSDAGIRGPLHPRRLRCPPSPYHRGYASGGRLAGRGASTLSMHGIFRNDTPETGGLVDKRSRPPPARCRFRSTQFPCYSPAPLPRRGSSLRRSTCSESARLRLTFLPAPLTAFARSLPVPLAGDIPGTFLLSQVAR